MAESFVPITPGVGVNVATFLVNGDQRQIVVVGDPNVTNGVAAVDATLGLSVNSTRSSKLTFIWEVDPTSGSILYMGWAPVGSSTSANVWQLKKKVTLSTSPTNIYQLQYPNGDSSPSYAWTLRGSYTYQ